MADVQIRLPNMFIDTLDERQQQRVRDQMQLEGAGFEQLRLDVIVGVVSE